MSAREHYIAISNYGVRKMGRKINDLTGQKFGRLIVIELANRNLWVNRRATWICKCECGSEKIVSSTDLVSNHTRSCGCLRVDRTVQGKKNFRHGHATTNNPSPTYRSWRSMLTRCNEKTHV